MSNESHPSPTGSSSSSLFGFDRLESSSPTTDWGKPVTSNNSAANGWSNFQQQQTVNNSSRSNTVGNNNPSSNQWPDINNFYAANSSNNVPFNLPQNNNDNMNNNNATTTWQDTSSSGNVNDMLTTSLGNINSSVINKHKSSSAMSVSLSGALKSAMVLSGTNADLLSGNSDSSVCTVPQPKLVEQLGWDEPEIKIARRGNFDDGTSIWGDPIDAVSMQIKKWTNGTKAALANSTNIILQQQQQQQQQQQPAMVQKNTPTNMQTLSSTAANSQMMSHDENWPKQQSPTVSQPSSSQWNDESSTLEQSNASVITQSTTYRAPQSASSNWNVSAHQGGHNSDDWFRDGVVDTSDWGLQGSQNKVPFDPYEGQVDTSGWGVQGGAMSGPLGMPSLNRNRPINDYDPNDNSHDPHTMHRMAGYDNQPMGDMYRQGPDLKSPIIGIGGLLPSSTNAPAHHMLPPNQLPFAPRPGQIYPPNSILRPMNPNGIPAPSGAIMGTGSLISPKLSTSSPVPNQAPYVPLSAKPNNIPVAQTQTTTSQPQPSMGPANNGTVHAQIMQQFRLAVQAGLISQDLLNTKLPPYMLQLLQKLFELQQKYQALTIQLADFSKHKQRFPITFFQTEYERLSKAIAQKKQDMLLVQKQIQDAHAKLLQQQSGAPTPTPTQMMSNGPVGQTQPPSGVSSTQMPDQLSERMQHALNIDQSRLTQWTKQQTSSRGSTQSASSMFGPPGLTQKDWQSAGNNPNENWENTQTNETNNTNQVGNMDSHTHNNQASSSGFGETLSEYVDDNDGPPPFVPGQLWNWKSLPNAEDDPHVTPSSLTMGPKGPSSSMNNLNVGGAESAFSNPQLFHQMHRQQANRAQWQQTLHDQQGFQPSTNDWNKHHQYRGMSKPPSSLNHPPPHASFGGYRPYI